MTSSSLLRLQLIIVLIIMFALLVFQAVLAGSEWFLSIADSGLGLVLQWFGMALIEENKHGH